MSYCWHAFSSFFQYNRCRGFRCVLLLENTLMSGGLARFCLSRSNALCSHRCAVWRKTPELLRNNQWPASHWLFRRSHHVTETSLRSCSCVKGGAAHNGSGAALFSWRCEQTLSHLSYPLPCRALPCRALGDGAARQGTAAPCT